MNKVLYIGLIVLTFNSCVSKKYTSEKHFDCKNNHEYKQNNDYKKLIYKTLERATSKEKELNSYEIIPNKTKFYIRDYYHNSNIDKIEYEKNKQYLKKDDIPYKIGEAKYCIKSNDELISIGQKTKQFSYLYFDYINVKENKATICLSIMWNKSTLPVWKKKLLKIKDLYGGEQYIIEFIKKNNKWEFHSILHN